MITDSCINLAEGMGTRLSQDYRSAINICVVFIYEHFMRVTTHT